MSRVILLDSFPAGLATNPKPSDDQAAIVQWIDDCLQVGHRVILPEIIDYELRRELLRAKKVNGLANLDRLKNTVEYLPLNTPTMLLAAQLWAQARQTGNPTAAPQKIDIDVILAAQALSLGLPDTDFVVATSNVGHLTQFVPAALWSDILP